MLFILYYIVKLKKNMNTTYALQLFVTAGLEFRIYRLFINVLTDFIGVDCTGYGALATLAACLALLH